jgi:protein-S-isoprenylcysteine O-methyltransferase Ste14
VNTTENPKQEPAKRASIPWWMAFVVALIVYNVGSWAISLLTPRYGWAAGSPGLWNLLGLIPVVVGTIGLLWTMVLHFAQSPEGVEMALAKSYLLRHGPYNFTRNPMFLADLALVFGWALFYGSVILFIGFLAACALFNFVAVPLEERALEVRFGDAYREYKNKVPRWFGKIRR